MVSVSHFLFDTECFSKTSTAMPLCQQLERVPIRYGLIYTPKRASFDLDRRKRLGLYKEEKFIYFSSVSYRVATAPFM